MIFCFTSESAQVSKLVLKIISVLDKASRPEDIIGLPCQDAQTLLYLLHQPPHVLTLEDIVFCQAAVQQLWTTYPAMRNHHVSVSLAQNIDIEDRDGCRVYYISSAAKGHRTLQF